jgi:hypothetical protein
MGDDRSTTIRSTTGHLRDWQQAALIFVGAFALRAVTALAGFAHTDEQPWLHRSENYARAMLSLDLTRATSRVSGTPTMPGISTVFVGGAARVIWGGMRDLGVASYPGEPFVGSRSGLVIAQLLMAAATSALLVLLWWVLSNWATRVVATTAVVILATEPTLVADATKLKTDSFLMLFGAVAAFALAAALRVPGTRELDRRRRHLLAIAAGVGVGGALATKLTALAFGPFLLGLVVYAGLRAWRTRAGMRDVVVVTALTSVVAVGLLAILWPAAWADPAGQLDVLLGTARLAGAGRHQYFLGELTSDPGPLFYALTVPMRMTPWLFLLVIPAVIVSLRGRALRAFAFVALAYAALPLLVMLVSKSKFVRYSYPLWPVFAVLGGLLVQWIADECRRRGPARRRAFEVTAVGAIAGLVVYAALVVPYGGVYANPMLGGGPVAQEVMLIGGDVQQEAGNFIQDREGASCDDRRIRTGNRSRLWFRCGDLVQSTDDLRRGDYIVLFGTEARRDPDDAEELGKHGRRVARIQERGVDIAEIFQVP